MAEIKDKVVTVESLAALHEHNKDAYMPKTNPVGDGTMTMNGDANISGDMVVGSLMIGGNVRLVPTGDSLEIVFVNQE